MIKLPHIPYSMPKNRSTEITIRGLNLGAMASPGDIVESKNVSLRKYPFVTAEKKDTAEIESGNVGSITVFKNKLITKEEKQQFATINNKLTMFPSRTYQTEEGTVNNLFCKSSSTFTVFSNDSIIQLNPSASARILSGYGGGARGNEFSVLSNVKLSRNFAIGVTTDRQWKLCGLPTDTIDIWGAGGGISFQTTNIQVGQVVYLKYGEGYSAYTNFYKIKSLTDHSFDDGAHTEYIYYAELAPLDSQNTLVSLPYDVKPTAYETGNDNTLARCVGEAIQFGDATPCILRDEIDSGVFYLDDADNDTECTIYSNAILVRWNYDFKNLASDAQATVVMAGFVAQGKISSSSSNIITFKKKIVDGVTYVSSSPIYGKSYVIIGDCEIVFPKFNIGDVVSVRFVEDKNNPNNTEFKISDIKDNAIYAGSEIFRPGAMQTRVIVERTIPNLDFVCEKDNRLYGCSNKDNTIYASALGDPTNMYAYEGVSTDSYAVAVGSDGAFTGCCEFGNSVLFFKENMIYKLTGSYPAEYVLYSYNTDGVQSGCGDSLVSINETLYYKGKRGVFAYGGDLPTLISESFGDRRFKNAVAGTDGESYYISMCDENEKYYLFSFNTRLGIWMQESNMKCDAFARLESDVYYISDGNVYKMHSTQDSSVEWHIQYAPMYETLEGKKTHSRLIIRAEIPRGSYVIFKMRCDDGIWLDVGKIVGKSSGIVPIRIPINRCDKFELRIEGKGEFTLQSMMREFYVHSEA